MRKHFIDASFPRSHHATFHNSAKRDQVRDGSCVTSNAGPHGDAYGPSVSSANTVPTATFWPSTAAPGHGLPSTLSWHHDRCTPDSCRFAAALKSAESGHKSTFW